MSTHIIDRIVAIKIGAGRYGDEEFIVVQEGGDNNLIDCITNKRCRSWYPTVVGKEYEVLQEACKWAEGCCGGCYKLHGRRTTPEGFIRAYRRALKEALTVEEARAKGIQVFGLVKLGLDDVEGDKIRQAKLAEWNWIMTREEGHGSHWSQAFFHLTNADELAKWKEVRQYKARLAVKVAA